MLTHFEDEPELLSEMIAHRGKCHACGNIVKMLRGEGGALTPQNCYCLYCGKRYFMQIDDLSAWEEEQWKQKSLRYD